MQASQQLNRAKIISRASARQRLVAAVVLAAAIGVFGLLVLAANDKVEPERWLGRCGFKQKYGLPCPSCGITTSAIMFVQGRILESFYVQPAAALLCSALAVSAFLALLVAVFGVYFSFLKRLFAEIKIRHIILAMLIIVVAGWAVTLARVLATEG